MPTIPDSISDLAIGAGGTVLYLYIWNSALARWADKGKDPLRQRQRRRLVQILLFVLLTPYVLLLFWCMDAVRPW